MSDELVLAYGTEWLSLHYGFQVAYDEAVRKDEEAALSLLMDVEGAGECQPLRPLEEGDDVRQRGQEQTVWAVPGGGAV